MDPLRTVTHTARDAMYVAVGLGLLGFNQAQVRRRELTSTLTTVRDDAARQLADTPLAGPLRLLGARPDSPTR
jgi:hypothetical protein